MDEQTDPAQVGGRPWVAVVLSVALHAALILAGYLAHDGARGAEGGDPFAVDVEVAPEAPEAELLPDELAQQDRPITDRDVVVPEPPPPAEPTTPEEPEAPEEPETDDTTIGLDAGVDAAEPTDGGTEIADEDRARDAGPDGGALALDDESLRDAGADRDAGALARDDDALRDAGSITDDGGARVATSTGPGATSTTPGGVADGGVPSSTFGDEGGKGAGAAGTLGPRGPVSAGTAANLLAYFPKNHVVTVLIRFDRLRGTEWAQVAQDVLAVMPDYETLVADPKTVIADKLDLIAISTPQPRDVRKTLVAMKPAMTPKQLRDFLDEPGAPVTWQRVVGGVMGKRAKGKRVFPKDRRIFLSPFVPWMVLANPKDLPGLLDPAEGELDSAAAEASRLPEWLRRIPDLEAESGIPDGPALMMTLAPRAKRWDLPDVGLGVTSLPAPERLTLSLEIDRKGFVVRGNVRFHTEEDARIFVDRVEAARQAALDSAAHAALLKRARALNAVKGLSLKRTDHRVSYATSISIADARILMAAGLLAVSDYFEAAADEEE